jgi:murein DD-endopeptidase MepM/ murein hydrolase activator NlpD
MGIERCRAVLPDGWDDPIEPIWDRDIEEEIDIDYDEYDGYDGSGSDNDRRKDQESDKLKCWADLTTRPYARITEDWGWRTLAKYNKNTKSTEYYWDFHPAWDIGVAGNVGLPANTPANVEIIKVGRNHSFNGNYVEMKVQGTGEFIKYIHLASIGNNVTQGTYFSSGREIGKIGNTPTHKGFGIHLHLAIWKSHQEYLQRYNGNGIDENERNNTVKPENFFGNECPKYNVKGVNDHENDVKDTRRTSKFSNKFNNDFLMEK